MSRKINYKSGNSEQKLRAAKNLILCCVALGRSFPEGSFGYRVMNRTHRPSRRSRLADVCVLVSCFHFDYAVYTRMSKEGRSQPSVSGGHPGTSLLTRGNFWPWLPKAIERAVVSVESFRFNHIVKQLDGSLVVYLGRLGSALRNRR